MEYEHDENRFSWRFWVTFAHWCDGKALYLVRTNLTFKHQKTLYSSGYGHIYGRGRRNGHQMAS